MPRPSVVWTPLPVLLMLAVVNFLWSPTSRRTKRRLMWSLSTKIHCGIPIKPQLLGKSRLIFEFDTNAPDLVQYTPAHVQIDRNRVESIFRGSRKVQTKESFFWNFKFPDVLRPPMYHFVSFKRHSGVIPMKFVLYLFLIVQNLAPVNSLIPWTEHLNMPHPPPPAFWRDSLCTESQCTTAALHAGTDAHAYCCHTLTADSILLINIRT